MCVTIRHDMTLPVNYFPNKPWFLHVCSKSLVKTLWEKEKFLVRSNSSFTHNFLPFSSNLKLLLANSSVWKNLKVLELERVEMASIEVTSNRNRTNQRYLVNVHSQQKDGLTLSSIYTHFNTLKKKAFGKHCGKKVKLLKMSYFTFFLNIFYAMCILTNYQTTHLRLLQTKKVCSRQFQI